jgi:hypothetical protein
MPRSAAIILAALALLTLVALKFDPAAGFTPLLRFGDPWASKRLPATQQLPIAVVPNSVGYDGQFYAQLAVSPALRDAALDAALDAPAYRARRILAPATAHFLGLGRPWFVLNAYALLNVACWFVFALLLAREIPLSTPDGVARWLACVFSLGVLDSVRQSLVDLPALLLLLLSVRAFRAEKHPATGLAAALGHLTKETNLLASAALLLARPRFDWRRVTLFAVTALPLGSWSLYVAARFPGSSLSTGTGNFTWPFVGALGQLATSTREILSGNFDSRHTFALLGIAGLALQAATLLRHRTPADPWWRIGVAYAALLAFLGPWVWSGYWAACRAALPLTLAFNLLLRPGPAFWPLWIFGNLTALHGVWRFL